MTTTLAHQGHHHHDHHIDEIDIFGFWLYILSDCILFAIIFACYAVLHTSIYGGPELKTLISRPYILTETMVLLTSSFTYGLGILALYHQRKNALIFMLLLTTTLGAIFVGMELNEFINLYHEGHTWQSSPALAAFFTLVGTHGLHVSIGLGWMLILILQILIFDLSPVMQKRLTYLGLFWAFLDIIWIFVFTIVYLMETI